MTTNLGNWFMVGIANDRAFVGCREMPRSFAPLRKAVMVPRKEDEDEAERQHERGLRAVDPRVGERRFRPRMNMLEDEPISRFELGTHLEEFIDPDERGNKS